MNAVMRWLPAFVDTRVKVFAIATLVAQLLIVGTGGAVRLTGSGLGCPTWPTCTDESLIATPEMGINGAIEFGNRLLSIIVGLIAVAMFVLLLRIARERRDLFTLSILIGAGTVLQGLIGGLSVRVKLDPSVVGVHFVISAILVALSAVLVYRVFAGRRGTERVAPKWLAILVHATSALIAVTIVVGVLTTGSGPHAGDDVSARNGLDPEVVQHVHSWPAYATFVATLVLVWGAVRTRERLLVRFSVLLLVIELVQIVVGVVQSRLGLPILLVGIHMVLACCLAAATAAVVLSLRSSVPDLPRDASITPPSPSEIQEPSASATPSQRP